MFSWAYNWIDCIQDTRIKNLKIIPTCCCKLSNFVALWEDVLVVRYLEHAWCQLLRIILSLVQSGSGIQCVLSECGKLDFQPFWCYEHCCNTQLLISVLCVQFHSRIFLTKQPHQCPPLMCNIQPQPKTRIS